MPLAQLRLDEARGRAVLQAPHIERAGVEAFAVERARQRLDGCHVAGQDIGAIEHDDGEGPALLLGDAKGVHAVQRHGLGRQPMVGRGACKMCHERQRASHIRWATLGKISVEPIKHGALHGGEAPEPWVVAAVARQERQRNAGGATGMGHLLGAIAPIVEAAEQADDDAVRIPDHLLHIEVDGHGMAELAEIGEPKRGQGAAASLPSGSGAPKVAVDEGQEHEVGA